MPKDVPPSRMGRGNKTATGKTTITWEQAKELLPLHEKLAIAAIAAREAVRIASEKPSPTAVRKLRDLDLQIDAIISRINQILGWETSMSEDVPRSGDTITPKECVDLMRLYAELTELASKARDALNSVPVALQRLRDLDARIKEKIDSIKAIVK